MIKHTLIVKLLFVLLLINFKGWATYTLSPFDNTWCTTTYPTAYATGSWSITESTITGNDGLSKNQSAKTIIIDLTGSFEFNTASATATVTIGPSGVSTTDGALDFSSVSFVFTSTTRLTVTLTAKNQQLEYNSLNFNNFEIRSTGAGTGNIIRNGGTFKIDNSTALPATTEFLGTLTAQSPFSYTSTTISQAQNGVNIPQYSINKEILMIRIIGAGSCSGSLTQFNFNTTGSAGTDLVSNITTSKVYFTGASSTFATTSLFGTTASPNGAFSITGTQSLSSGDNYFWLTYDVPGDANTDAATPLNRLDALLESFILEGSTINSSFTTPNPAGSRPIVGASFYYSREDGTWNNNTTRWSTSDGGPACSCQPNGSGVTVVKHNITVDVNRTVDVIEIRDLASLLNNGTDKTLIINGIFTTFGSGYFNLRSNPLTVAGNLVLNGTGASVNSKLIDIAGNLEIYNTTSLDGSGAGGGGDGESMFIGGSLIIDGSLTHTGGNDIIMDGGVFSISGTGTVGSARSFIIRGGNKSIPLGTNLTITPPFEIEGAYTVTNNGTISLLDNLDGNNASSQWTNAASAILNYGGASRPFITNGIFEAVASTNTVNYNRAGAQTIIRPNNSGQYNILTLGGSGTKTLDQNIRVSNDFTFNTAFAHNNRDVTFNGTVAQAITGTTAPTFYNLTISNSSATGVTLNFSTSVANVLSFTDGELILNSNTLTVTNSAASGITGGSAASYIKSEGESSILKWDIGTTLGDYYFPFGNAGVYLPFRLNKTTAGTGAGSYSVSIWYTAANASPPSGTSVCPDENFTTDRFWLINLAGYTANPTADVYFYYNEAELDGIAEADLQVQRWDAADAQACKWVTPTIGTVDALNNYVSASGISQFSPWAMSNRSSPLPITLLSFEAFLNNDFVDLNWFTSSEINNDFFTIEKTKDGLEFENVSKIRGAGTSNVKKEYRITDKNPYRGISYYRLKQTDFDGNYTYSELIAVDNTDKRKSEFTVFPNPSDGKGINIIYRGIEKKEEILVVLNSVDGREVFTKVIVTDDDGSFIFAVDTENKLIPGVYLITGSSRNEFFSRKLIVK